MSLPKYLAIALFSLSTSFAADDVVEFNRDVRPILSENCFYCHGFDEKNRKADLRLDTFAGATADGAIVPGDSKASEVMSRISAHYPDDIMPPPETEKTLMESQKEIVGRWIDQGAKYQVHWAWDRLERPGVPGGKSGAEAIDAILAGKWQDVGVTPVGKASPRELIRRLSYDLRGLVPTAAEVAEFEADPSDAAFVKFRNRWMAEISYAEHQAVRWLDLVRWADSSGFVSDEPIASGAYRAWIIEAIRENMPFDQFSTEQLAGDLLPNPTDGQLVASGYNRIVNTNCEAGAIEEEQLYKLKGEHVRAVGTVWMAMTTGCAECHDHKFDPLLAKDYYSLAAFFDDLVEAGVYTPGDRREPLHYVHEDKKNSQLDRELVSEISALKYQMSQTDLKGKEVWRNGIVENLNDTKSHTDFVWAPAQLPAPRILEGEFVTVEGGRETVAAANAFLRHHAAEFMTGYVNEGTKKGEAWFVDVWIDPEDRPEMLGVQISHGDYGRLGWLPANYETYYWGTDASGVLAESHAWSDPKRVKRLGDLPKETGWVRLRVPLDQRVKAVGGQAFEAVGMAWLQTGGRVRWGDSGLDLTTNKTTAFQLGETTIRKWDEVPMNRQVYERRAEFAASAVKVASEKRTELQQEIVTDAYRENVQAELMAKLRGLENALSMIRARALPVLVSRKADVHKTTRVLNRGDYQDTTGRLVTGAVPEFLGDVQGSRLDLACWLFSEENPLTARVFVNRLWHQFFGRGISETLDDAGTQGAWPSHIHLLDWLAVELRESGWDRNHMVRLITSTRAYQLSSKPSAKLVALDPENRLIARQGRFRMSAEAIRDAALNAAGLLQTTSEVPMRSFFPYQPEPYWKSSSKVMYGSRHLVWETSPEEAQFHRSMYTFWKRQNVHPTMLTFDAPTRQECTAERNVTNTAGQALALLNDPIFVEAARVLAARVSGGSELSDEAQLQNMFSLALQRQASGDEILVLQKLLKSQREFYTANPDEAKKLVSIGQSKLSSNPVETAAWTAVSRAVLNLHEFLNRS
jgi:hypothetical protein